MVISRVSIKNGISFEGVISKVVGIAGKIPFGVHTDCDSKIELEFLLEANC